jgi:hypothetical protein
MSLPLLFELTQDRAPGVRVVAGRALAEWFGNGREGEGANGALASVLRNIEDLIGEAATFPDLMRRLCRSTGMRIQAHLVDDYASEEEALRRAFSAVAGAIEKLEELVRSLEGVTGRPPAGRAELAAARGEVERLRDQTLRHWPWPPTAGDVQRVREEVGRGEALELDAAFADIAGVSPEEWKRRVEEQKRLRAGAGSA